MSSRNNDMELAERMINAISKMAESEDNLMNFGFYLSNHFSWWMKQIKNNPAKLVEEMELFANMTWER